MYLSMYLSVLERFVFAFGLVVFMSVSRLAQVERPRAFTSFTYRGSSLVVLAKSLVTLVPSSALCTIVH